MFARFTQRVTIDASASMCRSRPAKVTMEGSLPALFRWQLPRLLVALMFSGLAGIAAAHSDNLVLQGSTAFTTALVDPFAGRVEAQTGLHLDITPNKSSLGLLALLERRAELAMISTSLEQEVEIVRKLDPGLPFQRLRAFEVARSHAAFVVHPENPVRNAKLKDIAKILTGEISNWKQLGGLDLPIRVVAVREGGGALAAVEAVLLGTAHVSAADPIKVQMGTQVVRVVAQERGALGITQLAIVKSSSAVELITDQRIDQVLSLVSLGDPSPNAIAVIEAFRRTAKPGL
jgi:phosphate transport system substrate-binding protein